MKPVKSLQPPTNPTVPSVTDYHAGGPVAGLHAALAERLALSVGDTVQSRDVINDVAEWLSRAAALPALMITVVVMGWVVSNII